MLLLLAAQLLQPGAIIDREIKTGDSHKYEVRLDKGQFLHCLATQYRIDLAMLLDDQKEKMWVHLDKCTPRKWSIDNEVLMCQRSFGTRLAPLPCRELKSTALMPRKYQSWPIL